MATQAVTERFVKIRGLKTHLLEAGEGPPVVYLHGAGGAGRWSQFHDLLAAHFHVYAPSHPGFGLSDSLDWLEAVDDLALHYVDLFDALDLERPSLIGSSIGGWVAAELCVWRPDRVARLVLQSAAGLRRDGVDQPDSFAADDEQMARLLYHDPSLAPPVDNSPEAVERRLRDKATMARIAWNPYLHNPRLRHRLYRITVPTLVIWGENDRLIPLPIGQLWAEELPNARLVVLPRCGHVVHRERPVEMAQAVIDFLSS